MSFAPYQFQTTKNTISTFYAFDVLHYHIMEWDVTCLHNNAFYFHVKSRFLIAKQIYLRMLCSTFYLRKNKISAFYILLIPLFVSLLFVFCRIVIIHIYYTNLITGDNIYSKLSLVDLAGSESSRVEDETGERATELLHVLKSLSA